MAKLSNLIEGLKILQPHFTDGDGYHTGAEHDVFYVYPTDIPLSAGEVKRLVALDWFQDNVDTGDDEFEAKHYDADEGWSIFT